MKTLPWRFFKIFIFLSVSFSAFAQTEINKLDSKGRKNGLWKGVYAESKRPRYEGTFNNGKETGTFKYFDDTKSGAVVATRQFNDKDNSAYTTFYSDGKYKVSEGREVNHLYDGKWIYYHENLPDIMAIEYYKAGKLNGKRTVYYRSSGVSGEENIAEEINYVDGKKQGSYKKYTLKGTLLEDSNYKNDVLDGPATYNDGNGKLVSKGNFKNGEKTGKWQYFENGKPLKKEISEKLKRHKPTKPRTDPEE